MYSLDSIYDNKFYEKSKEGVINTYKHNTMKDDKLFENQEHFCHHINAPCFDLVNGNIYVEIGSFYGHSASVIANLFYNKEIICIDIFNNSYFKSVGRIESDWNCPPKNYRYITEENVNKFNNNNKVNYIEGWSCSNKTLTKLKNILNNREIDVLFIDGDHRKEYVISDFENYFPLVKKNGFILFDDYHQVWNMAKRGVDYICQKYKSKLNILGLAKDKIKIHEEEKKCNLPHSLRKDMDTEYNNIFIVEKL